MLPVYFQLRAASWLRPLSSNVRAQRMRVDICDPSDEAAVARFESRLRQLGATSVGKSWAIGVDVLELQIGQEVLTVYSDAWSIDVEGPEHLVQMVVQLPGKPGSAV
jgi:hypothetical protein